MGLARKFDVLLAQPRQLHPPATQRLREMSYALGCRKEDEGSAHAVVKSTLPGEGAGLSGSHVVPCLLAWGRGKESTSTFFSYATTQRDLDQLGKASKKAMCHFVVFTVSNRM